MLPLPHLYMYWCVHAVRKDCVPECYLHLTLHLMYTHTHPFNGPYSGTTRVGRYEKGKTNLDFTEARDSEWQWHQLGHMQVCTSIQTDNHASTSPLSFYRLDALPSASNSVKALKANYTLCIHAYKSVVRKKLWERIWGVGIGWLDGKDRLEEMEF